MSDFPSQFTGPLVQATIAAIMAENDYADPYRAYLYGLSIATANEDDLANIGLLVGLPWPTVPEGYIDNNGFTLGAWADFPDVDHDHGLGTVGDTYGGHLGSVFLNVGDLIPISLYRLALTAYAILKYQNVTIYSIDVLCNAFGTGYIIQIPRLFFTFGSAAGYPTIDLERGFSGVGLFTGGPLSSVLGGDPDSDFYIQFPANTPGINLYVLQGIFDKVCTDPRVFISVVTV